MVAYEDLKRDLKYWESLVSSSFMMRPHSTLLGEDAELHECQQRNLNSALAFSLLTSPKLLNADKSVLTEQDLYETIVQIPHYQQKQLQLLNKEDEDGVVEDNLEEFQKMYRPLIQNEFSDVMQINGADGSVEISREAWAQRKIAMMVNDNVFKNLQWGSISVSSFDPQAIVSKDEFTTDEKAKLVEGLLTGESQSNVEPLSVEGRLDRARDKILILHRNTKILLFMLTGPFLVIF